MARKQGYTNVRCAKAEAATKGALTMGWENVAPKAQRYGRR
jgi:hypothetical protein